MEKGPIKEKKVTLVEIAMAGNLLLQEPYFSRIVKAKKNKDKEGLTTVLKSAGLGMPIILWIHCVNDNCGWPEW